MDSERRKQIKQGLKATDYKQQATSNGLPATSMT
jgi:hypothetical protein